MTPTPIEALRELVEAALWYAYCPAQGGYRHTDERDGRSVEDCWEQLQAAAEKFTGHAADDHPAAWAAEEDAEAIFGPALAALAHPVAQEAQAQAAQPDPPSLWQKADPSAETTAALWDRGARWRLRLFCCGREDGLLYAKTWHEADSARNDYTSGPGVHPNGYSAPQYDPGHKRAAIVEQLADPAAQSVPVAHPQPAAGWVSVQERLPRPGVCVLFGYRNTHGKWRTIRGHHSPLHTIEASTWEDGADETEDGSFEPEGWWEEPVECETLNYVSDEVTHWMPLPAPPAETAERGEKRP